MRFIVGIHLRLQHAHQGSSALEAWQGLSTVIRHHGPELAQLFRSSSAHAISRCLTPGLRHVGHERMMPRLVMIMRAGHQRSPRAAVMAGAGEGMGAAR